MSIETYQFNLPITPGAIPPVLHLSQYDSGRTFTAILRDDANVPFELDSGATAVIKGRNAAGIAWQQDCTVSGANVTFTPSGAATDQFGVMPVTIEITESEEIISPLCVVFHIQKAGYTNEEAVLSPDFETAIQAAVTQAISEGGLGFSDEFKEALLACFNGVAWATTGGQALVDDLEAALYPEVHLVSITAAYDQDRPIYNTDPLSYIKFDLVVTANYSDGSSETLSDSDYEVSGTLTVGTSTLTVSYEGKTDTISVVVSDMMVLNILTLDGRQNTRAGHDSSSTKWEDLSGNENDFDKKSGASDVTWGSDYAGFDATDRRLLLNKDILSGATSLTVELVLKITGNGSYQNSGTYYGMVFTNNNKVNSATNPTFRYNTYNANGMSSQYGSGTNTGWTGDLNTSIRHVVFVYSSNECKRYVDGELAATTPISFPPSAYSSKFSIGGITEENSWYPNCHIHRIGISNTALTAEQIAQRYTAFKSLFNF